jgi:plasmid stability protein
VPTLTVKNVPPELHRRLKERAERNRRSLNGELLECLREAAMPRRVDPDALLAAARELRGSIRGRLTEARLRAQKNAGRN